MSGRTTSLQPARRGIIASLAAIEDGTIVRFVFFALLLGTASVLYVDYRELNSNAGLDLSTPLQPILPPASTGPVEGQPAPVFTTDPNQLDNPLTITLGTAGQLLLTGSFDLGSAERFRAEIDARGEYVQTVVLDSPGGSVSDALAIGRLIQEKGLSTAVRAGALCASSCPLVFAGGAERLASKDAAIGVHQIYAAALGGGVQDALRVAGTAMSDAQKRTGEIMAYLSDTGADPALWLHALETPPDRLYYFTPEEMTTLRLATRITEE